MYEVSWIQLILNGQNHDLDRTIITNKLIVPFITLKSSPKIRWIVGENEPNSCLLFARSELFQDVFFFFFFFFCFFFFFFCGGVRVGVRFDQITVLTLRIRKDRLYSTYSDRHLSKQCRPWSDAAERGVWSGSTLFATHPAILHAFKCSKRDLLKVKIR